MTIAAPVAQHTISLRLSRRTQPVVLRERYAGPLSADEAWGAMLGPLVRLCSAKVQAMQERSDAEPGRSALARSAAVAGPAAEEC